MDVADSGCKIGRRPAVVEGRGLRTASSHLPSPHQKKTKQKKTKKLNNKNQRKERKIRFQKKKGKRNRVRGVVQFAVEVPR